MAEKRKYADRREELIKAVSKRRRKIKALAIEYKGSKCQKCILICANCHREIGAGVTILPTDN